MPEAKPTPFDFDPPKSTSMKKSKRKSKTQAEPEIIDSVITKDEIDSCLEETLLEQEKLVRERQEASMLINMLENQLEYFEGREVAAEGQDENQDEDLHNHSASISKAIDKIRETLAELRAAFPIDDFLDEEETDDFQADIDDANDFDLKPATLSVDTTDTVFAKTTVNYATNQIPAQGVFRINILNLGWNNYPSIPKSRAESAAKGVVNNYKRLSQGRLIFETSVYNVKVDYPHEARYIGAAERVAKSRYPNTDLFMVITNKLGTSHAGVNTAIVRGTLIRDQLHELGHILKGSSKPRRVLGHSGVYVIVNGKEKLKAYHDPGSFMGRFSSVDLVPPQMWYLGWAGENRTAEYKISDGIQEFTLVPGRLYYKDVSQQPKDELTGVLINNPKNSANLRFIALAPYAGKMSIAAWDVWGGTTQRKAVFSVKSTPRNWGGLTIENVREDGERKVIRFTPPQTLPSFSAVRSIEEKKKAQRPKLKSV